MEQVIVTIIQHLNQIEVRGEHAQRLGACIKALHELLAVLQEAKKEENQKG